jgi:hypothetical protein
MKYFHPSSIPVEVVEVSLAEIEAFVTNSNPTLEDFFQAAFKFAYELKNILVCGTVKDNP